MEIKPNEIEEIRVIGDLYEDDVKLIKTIGGFYLAVGRKKANSKKPEALAAGAHEAIVAHQVSKNFGADFKPAIFKSEAEQLHQVEEKDEYLSKSNIDKGIKLYVLQKQENLSFVLSRRGSVTLAQYNAYVEDGALCLQKGEFATDLQADKNLSEALSRAIQDKAYDLGLSKIEKR